MTDSRWPRWAKVGGLFGGLAAMAVFGVACDGDTSATPAPTAALSPSSTATSVRATVTPVPLKGSITVFAASSLTDAFKEAAATFTAKNPKANVTFNFAASSALATQINEGAPADVFASADSAQMKVVADKGNLAGAPALFATNAPAIVVPKSGSPVALFADLAKPGVKLVLAAPEVPIGKYARDILTNASRAGGVGADFSDRVLANLRSNEANVKAVLAKVQLGEADAGIVYTTDVATVPNDVRVVEIPAQYNVVAQYPVAVVKGSKNAAVAQAWVDFLLGTDGQAVLAKYGFGRKP